jgi:hypothetical protein
MVEILATLHIYGRFDLVYSMEHLGGNMIGHEDMIKLMELASAFVMIASWRAGKLRPEDKEIIDAHDAIVSGVGDADFVTRVEMATGRNIRDQISVEGLQKLGEEVKLLKMGNARN